MPTKACGRVFSPKYTADPMAAYNFNCLHSPRLAGLWWVKSIPTRFPMGLFGSMTPFPCHCWHPPTWKECILQNTGLLPDGIKFLPMTVVTPPSFLPRKPIPGMNCLKPIMLAIPMTFFLRPSQKAQTLKEDIPPGHGGLVLR